MTKCFSCKSETMENSTSTYTAQAANCIAIIKNVPCMKCRQCGDVVYNTKILKKIEEIIGRIESMASEVAIVDYQKSA